MTGTELIMTVAVVVGPVLAVIVTRIVDDLREKRHRKLELFRTLLRTRGIVTSADHVGALNLVEIEFYRKTKIIEALKKLMAHYNSGYEPLEGERLNDTDNADEVSRKKSARGARVDGIRRTLLTNLLNEIAQELKYEKSVADLVDGGYTPQLWQTAETELDIIRHYLVELAVEDKVLRVQNVYDPDETPVSRAIAGSPDEPLTTRDAR